MPVEVRELIIRATLTDESNASDEKNNPNIHTTSPDQDAVVAACVQQVLKILARNKER